MNAFHPSLERVFDVDYNVHDDVYAVSSGFVIGERLDVAIVDVDSSTVLNWIRQALQALQYLHRLGLCHRRLRPSHIICSLERCVLVGISILPNNEFGNKDSINLAAHSQSELNEDTEDLVALWMSFLVSYLDCKPENLNSHIDSAS